jgi:hypothetical protein
MATELRPLGLGELLDRAVTLFVRRFGILVGATAVAYVPFAFFQWAALVGMYGRQRTSFTRAEWMGLGIDLALGLLAYVLARTAVAARAHASYMSQTLSLRAAYRLATARFGAQIVVNIVSALAGVLILIVAAIPVFMIELIAVPGGGPGTALIALGIVGALALFPCAWLFLAYELATVRIVTDTQHLYTALFAALRTVLRRPWHSLLAAFTLLLVVAGGTFLFSTLAELMPSQALRTFMLLGVGSVGSILIETLSVTFLVVYNVDLAIRHEGVDLTAALDAASGT